MASPVPGRWPRALQARYRGQPPTVLTAAMEARILEKTRQAPPEGSTHWSTRKLGRLLKISHNLVAKAWQRAGLQPLEERARRSTSSYDSVSKPSAVRVFRRRRRETRMKEPEILVAARAIVKESI